MLVSAHIYGVSQVGKIEVCFLDVLTGGILKCLSVDSHLSGIALLDSGNIMRCRRLVVYEHNLAVFFEIAVDYSLYQGFLSVYLGLKRERSLSVRVPLTSASAILLPSSPDANS